MPKNSGKINIAVLLLIVAVALFSCCLLWFMNQAMQSEQFAVRQRLIDTNRQICKKLIDKSQINWNNTTDYIKSQAKDSQSALLALILGTAKKDVPQKGFANGIIIYNANNKIIWPAPSILPEQQQTDDEIFQAGWKLEFQQQDYITAIKEYAGIATLTNDDKTKQQAMVAQARCLQKSGMLKKAIEMCQRAIVTSDANNVQNRIFLGKLLIQDKQDAKKYVDELLIEGLDGSSNTFEQNALLLKEATKMAEQIIIVLGRPIYNELLETAIFFLNAIETSDELASKIDLKNFPDNSIYSITDKFNGFKIEASDKSTAIIIFDKDKAIEQTFVHRYAGEIPTGIFYKLYDGKGNVVKTNSDKTGDRLFEIAAGSSFPNWRIEIFLENDELFNSATSSRTSLYFYLGTFTIITFSILCVSIIIVISLQTKNNKLRNDFIATVTHELKTPLASTRMLVDTILEGRAKDEPTKLEYLEIISRENSRLTRLIDNFLAFSRMERNKNGFNMQVVDISEIATRASEAMNTKITANDCKFEMNIETNLPHITADFDAIVTALTNLLDNACKYSKDDKGEEKKIQLNVYAHENSVCFEIEDNGIGMTTKQTKKRFTRFYQADQRLNRKAEGCGLGLSIVKFILDAHHASIEVVSKPEIGSRFIIKFRKS